MCFLLIIVHSLFASEASEEQETTKDSKTNNFAFLKVIDGNFRSSLEKVKYGELDIQNFVGDLDFDKGMVKIKGAVKAMEGQLDIDGSLNALAKKPVLTLKVDCEGLNATEMFRQMQDFGQEMITSCNDFLD